MTLFVNTKDLIDPLCSPMLILTGNIKQYTEFYAVKNTDFSPWTSFADWIMALPIRDGREKRMLKRSVMSSRGHSSCSNHCLIIGKNA